MKENLNKKLLLKGKNDLNGILYNIPAFVWIIIRIFKFQFCFRIKFWRILNFKIFLVVVWVESFIEKLFVKEVFWKNIFGIGLQGPAGKCSKIRGSNISATFYRGSNRSLVPWKRPKRTKKSRWIAMCSEQLLVKSY